MFFRIILSATAVLLAAGTPGFAQKSNKPDPLRVLSSELLQNDLRLTKTQRQRVRELMLQWEGPRALRREDIAKDVGLRKTQREAIEKIYREHTRLEFEYYQLRKTDRDKSKLFYKGVKASARTLTDRVFEILTDSQRARFERMLGKPLDRSKLFEPKRRRPDV